MAQEQEQQAEQQAVSVKVFFCYSYKQDQQVRREIENHLSPLKHAGKITVLHRRKLLAGDAIEDDYSHLYEADIIFLLISADFISSESHWQKEMPIALEQREKRGAQVIPIIVRPVLWKDTVIGKLRALPTDGRAISKWPDRDEVLEDIAREIEKIVHSILAQIEEERKQKEKRERLEKEIADLEQDIHVKAAKISIARDKLDSASARQKQLEDELTKVKAEGDRQAQDIKDLMATQQKDIDELNRLKFELEPTKNVRTNAPTIAKEYALMIAKEYKGNRIPDGYPINSRQVLLTIESMDQDTIGNVIVTVTYKVSIFRSGSSRLVRNTFRETSPLYNLIYKGNGKISLDGNITLKYKRVPEENGSEISFEGTIDSNGAIKGIETWSTGEIFNIELERVDQMKSIVN